MSTACFEYDQKAEIGSKFWIQNLERKATVYITLFANLEDFASQC